MSTPTDATSDATSDESLREQQISSFRIFASSLRECGNLFVQVVRKGWAALLFIHAMEFALNQVFTYGGERLRMEGREEVLVIATAAALELASTLILTTASFLVIAHFASKERTDILQKFPMHFQQVIIEQLRSLAAVIVRIPLLILPALIQYARLIMVPLVVVFDENFKAGHVDALNESRRLSKGRLGLFSAMALLVFLLPAIAQYIPQGDSSPLVWENPSGVLLAAALTLLVNIAAGTFLVAVYQRLSMIGARS